GAPHSRRRRADRGDALAIPHPARAAGKIRGARRGGRRIRHGRESVRHESHSEGAEMETAVRLSNGGLSDRAELLILRGAYGFVFTVSDIFVVSDIRCVESIIIFVVSAAVSAVRAWSALWQAAPAAA